jgi:RNA polymerase-binding transcription factor DksA
MQKNHHNNGNGNGALRSKRLAPALPVNGNGAADMLTRPLPKSPLTVDELAGFRQLLLDKRRQLVGDMDSMENEALHKNRADASGDLSLMPIHMADIGTDNYEQEFTISLIEGERATLREIDEALGRIEHGTYGVCLATHKPISKARLKVQPWSRFCLEYTRTQEQSRRR